MTTGDKSLTRREALRAAVAVGGSAGLAACIDLESQSEDTTDDERSTGRPAGTESATRPPTRQHAWHEFSRTDEHGNPVPARHHVLLLAEYVGDGPVDDVDRSQVENAFRELEGAYRWASDGLLFTVGYSPAYFDRYDEPLPGSVDLPQPEAVASFEEPSFDTPDLLVHLASDRASAVLEAEQALFGESETANGSEITETVDETVEQVDRRTGFIGAGLPAEHDDVDGVPDGAVPEASPLFMGFKSGFAQNQATEDSVTIPDGPFAGGTTQHLSLIRTELDQWYNQDSRKQRVAKMFSATHAAEDLVEGVGENLGDSSLVAETGIAERVKDDAFEKGVVGHTQKVARARDEDGDPRLLRRDFATVDGGRTGVHFLSLQETITDFVETRKAMNGEDVANVGGVGTKNNNGILQYITTVRRGNYLVPPRSKRSFPRPT
ncbi:MAG: Tat pathway signal protein [Haloarcula sp.]